MELGHGEGHLVADTRSGAGKVGGGVACQKRE